ncbi:hypothetical protein LCGC14_0463720 [marine sediment metagenome]|uniref:Uncharacterized protein n=1 Tax=marine sediment metagenome TaxID=412755 RepID=A0A0F9SJH5_9ZZZZ
MLAGEFINSLAKMAGVPEDNEHLVKLLAVKEVATAEVADDFSTAILSKLMTMDAALNNPEIVNKLKAESLNAVDDKLGALAKDIFNADDTFIETLKTTKGTYNRMDLFAKHVSEAHAAAIKTLEESKGTTDDKGAKAELQKTIDDLNGELSGLRESTVSSTDHQAKVDSYENKILDLHKNSLFSNYDYALDVSKDVNILTASSLFNSELTKLGVEVVNDNGNLVLKTKLENGDYTKYFKDNKEVTPKDLADAVLAEHKLLKVSDTPLTPPTPGTPAVPPAPAGNGKLDNTEASRIAIEHVGSLQTLGEAQPAQS